MTTTFRLPIELWSQIFTLAVQDNLRTLPTLLAVNHMFQSIANRTPQPWTHLVFEIKDGHIDFPHTVSRLLRSGVLPLDIRAFNLDATHPTVLAKLLRKYVARIRTLEVNVQSYTIAESFLCVMGRNQPAPLLERLHIFYHDLTFKSRFDNLELSLRKVFYPAPRLTHISLPADPLPSDDSLPLFSRVKTIILDTNISVWRYSPDDVVRFLPSLPLLENFKFKGVDDSFEPTLPSELLFEFVPSLLSIDVTVPGDGLDIFRQLDADYLTHLRLDGRRPFKLHWDDAMAMTLMDTLEEKISVSLSMINRLELVCTKFPDPERDYPYILSGDAFPELKSLRLECTDITDEALRLCAHRLTNLKRLELWACRAVTGTGLLQFVQGCGADFELLLDSCPNVMEEDIATLSETVKVELQCNVFSEYIE